MAEGPNMRSSPRNCQPGRKRLGPTCRHGRTWTEVSPYTGKRSGCVAFTLEKPYSRDHCPGPPRASLERLARAENGRSQEWLPETSLECDCHGRGPEYAQLAEKLPAGANRSGRVRHAWLPRFETPGQTRRPRDARSGADGPKTKRPCSPRNWQAGRKRLGPSCRHGDESKPIHW